MTMSSTREKEISRRKLRKGTKSCWECKRRKVKCEFADANDEVCIACLRRGSKCISQEMPEELHQVHHDDSKSHLADRLLRVEALLSQIVQQKAGSPDHGSGGSPTEVGLLTPTPTVDTDILSSISGRTHDSPIFAARNHSQDHLNLFRKPPYSSSDSAEGRLLQISAALCAAYPSEKDLNIILSQRIDNSIYMPRVPMEPDVDLSFAGQDIIAELRERPRVDIHPVLVARQLLLMALTMQYFPHSSSLGLSEPSRAMTNRIAEEAIRLVTTNEDLHGSVESLECIILESEFHGNAGNLRRTWLATRRGIMLAQLMNLNQDKEPHLKYLRPDQQINHQHTWAWLVHKDRLLSMVLGLPYGVAAGNSGSLDPVFPSNSPIAALESRHTQIARRVMEYAASGSEDLDVVNEIDNLLVQSATCVPPDFWTIHQYTEPDAIDMYRKHRESMGQVYHYSLVSRLHLPYLLRPGTDHRYGYSKVSCLSSNRELLRRYIVFRRAKPVLSCCRPFDFMSMTAALTVLLAHMDMHRQSTMSHFTSYALAQSRASDIATLTEVLTTMDHVATLNDDAVTHQSASLLRRLMLVEADAAEGHKYTMEMVELDEDALPDVCSDDACSVLHMNIPYFGTVKIAREDATCPLSQQGFAARSVQIPMKNTIASQQESVIQQQISPQAPSFDSPTVSNDQMSALSRDPMLPYLAFPDLTATVDDWAFQGVDTAFFGSLMGNAMGSAEDQGRNDWPGTNDMIQY